MTVTTDEVQPVGEFRTDFDLLRLCPRCQKATLPIGYPGALSRTDNATEICSECGTVEALADYYAQGAPRLEPDVDWPVKLPYDPKWEAGLRMAR